MTTSTLPNKDQLVSPFLYRFLSLSIGVYFVFRLLFFATLIPHAVPPDEEIHVERVLFFQGATLIPTTMPSADSSHLRTTLYSPYLYYMIAGKWALVNVFQMEDLQFLRLLSIIFSCCTVFYGWKLISLLSENRTVHLLFLIILTNTLMFSAISAAVSYDSLTILFSTMLIYYLIEFNLKRSSISLVYLCLSIALGCLTKITTLPLAFVTIVCLLVLERKHLRHLKVNTKLFWKGLGKIQRGWVFITLLLITLNALLYGNNLLQFGHLVPRTDQVLKGDEILTYPAQARNEVYVAYIKGERSLEESLERARQIKNAAASRDTVTILELKAKQRKNGDTFKPISRLEYTVYWCNSMVQTTYGMLGHTSIFQKPTTLLIFKLILALTICSIGLYIKQGKIPQIEYVLMLVIIFYMFLLMQVINYSAYRNFHLLIISIQGRYMFPLIVPIYALIAKYMLTLHSQRLKALIALSIALLFIYGDFFFFMSKKII